MSETSSVVPIKTPMKAGANALLPIYPETFEEVMRFAKMATVTGMVKPLTTGFGQNKQTEDPDATLGRAAMIVMQGMEVGLPPMASVQLVAMINGRMAIHSEGVPGILLSKGFKIKKSFIGTKMADDWTAICELTRPDGEVFVSRFSVADAKQANLWDQRPTVVKYDKQKPNDSAWYCYPERMLWARALGFAAKDGGADALKGIMVREEMEDMLRMEGMRDITPAPQAAAKIAPPDIPDDAGIDQSAGVVPDVPDVPQE